MTNKRNVVWIKTKDYDKINNYDEVAITVEAKNRIPMDVFVNKYSEDELIREITIAENKQHDELLIKIGRTAELLISQNIISIPVHEPLTDFAAELINKWVEQSANATCYCNFDAFAEKMLFEKYGIKENQK